MPTTSMADLLSPDDVVPAFRADLKLADPVQGAGEKLVTVADPASGKSMAFRGFELSIARMLNGQRTAGQVIDAAEAIGLPISIEGLSGFVKKLRSLGFLSHPLDAKIEKPTTWGDRREWTEEVRARYQSALKEARSDELAVAKQHLEELLLDVPELTEAKDLLVWVEERLRAPGVGKKLPTFTDVFGVVERTWFEEGDRQSEQNARAQNDIVTLPPTPVAPAASEDSAASLDEPPVKKGGAGKVIVVLLLLLIAGAGAAVALVPLPHVAKGTYELQARNVVSVEAAREGAVAEVAVKDGDWVDADATLFSYDAEPAKKRLADVEKKLAELQKKIDKAPAGKKAAEARKKLDKAETELKDAKEDLDKANAKGKKPGITKAEKKVKKAEEKVAKAQKAVDAAGSGGVGGELKTELEKLTAEREAAKAMAEPSPFKAPAAGFVRGLQVKVGDVVKPGSVVCQLEDSKVLSVNIDIAKGEKLAEGQTASLTVAGKKVDVKIEKIINGQAKASLENKAGTLKPGAKGELTIDTGGRTLLSKYL